MNEKTPLLCDLHTHSNCSDGSHAPRELIGLAAAAGLSALALCDHNTVAGLEEFEQAAAGSGVIPLPGVEITAEFEGKEVHILGLFVKKEAREPLTAYLEAVNRRKEEANVLLAERLQAAGYAVDYREIKAAAGNATPNRAHFARALTEKGYVGSVKEAFQRLLYEGGPFYQSLARLNALEVVAFLASLGVLPALAHPYLSLCEEELHRFLPAAKERGLAALETVYPLFTEAESALAASAAAKYRLLPSGGSDFHGRAKPDIKLGRGRDNISVPFAYYEALERRNRMDNATHRMSLKPAPFAMMQSGRKTIELRLFDEKRSRIHVGDTILFTNTADESRLLARVLALHRFDSFAALYRSLPLLKCGYTEEDVQSADPADMAHYYDPLEQARFGVVGIELELL